MFKQESISGAVQCLKWVKFLKPYRELGHSDRLELSMVADGGIELGTPDAKDFSLCP